MDTDNASPKFNLGDRVRLADTTPNTFDVATGTVVDVDPDQTWPYMVRLDGADIRHGVYGHSDLVLVAPAPPLGVEPWRLLFRAYRDGWRLINHYDTYPEGSRHRTYLHAASHNRFHIDTVGPVR